MQLGCLHLGASNHACHEYALPTMLPIYTVVVLAELGTTCFPVSVCANANSQTSQKLENTHGALFRQNGDPSIFSQYALLDISMHNIWINICTWNRWKLYFEERKLTV